MSDMKCPFCQQELETDHDITYSSYCRNCDLYGDNKLWGKIDRTKKQLEIAVDALKSVRKNLCEMPDPSGATIFRMACESATTVKKALDQITALEQKE